MFILPQFKKEFFCVLKVKLKKAQVPRLYWQQMEMVSKELKVYFHHWLIELNQCF